MTKPKYNCEDWKSGKLLYEEIKDLPNPEGLQLFFNLSPDDQSDKAFEEHKAALNDPQLILEWGDMEKTEYLKVVEHRKSAYRLALDMLFKGVEPYLNTYLKKDNALNQMLIKKRMEEIDSYFESVVGIELQKAVSGELLEFRVDGPTYKQFMESRDISVVMHLLFNSNTAPGIRSALPGYKKHPSVQILLRVLLEERNHLIARSGQLNLTAKTILDKYEEFKKDASGTKATEKLRSWLVDELKLPVEHGQRVYDITIDSEALRQRIRRRDAKSKKS